MFISLGAKEIDIAINGIDIGEFSIIVKNNDRGRRTLPVVNSTEYKAALQLRSYIAKISGKTLPITFDNEWIIKDKEILIGNINREECKEIDYSALKLEEYIITTKGNKLLFAGGKRGILYGVYSFIEKYFGVMYLTSTIEKIKYADRIEISNVNERYNPPFEYREIMWWESWHLDFAVKQRINGTFGREFRKEDGYGAGYVNGVMGLVHTFHSLVPVAKYYKEHPEYYALVNGERKGGHFDGQLCLTNPDVLKISTDTVLDWLNKEESPSIVSISINDNGNYCQCENCKKIDDQEESHAGTLIHFVNAIADVVKKHYPDVVVDTIAYSYARKAPKFVKPRDNVAVRFCSVGCRNHPQDECNAPYRDWDFSLSRDMKEEKENIETWASLCKKMYVWDYTINFNNLNSPFPNFHTMLPNIKYFKDHNAKGIYAEACTDSGEFSELRIYLTAKILWNPDMSSEEFYSHMDDFLTAFYGKGAKYIREYIDLCKEEVKDIHFGCNTPLSCIIPIEKSIIGGKTVFNMDFINKAKNLWEKALDAAETESEKRRIDKSKIQIDYYELFLTMEERYNLGDEQERAMLVQMNKDVYFKMVKYGIKRIIENCELPIITDFTIPPNKWIDVKPSVVL